MKKTLLEMLICPACLPEEIQLRETVRESAGDDIQDGELNCPECGRMYPIENGIADLEPAPPSSKAVNANKYETAPVLSSYLWSHYADILQEENASDAYRKWADLLEPQPGIAVDAGTAVGRFAFELTQKSDFVVGLDTSRAFIRAARELMDRRNMTVSLKQEGHITRDVTLSLPPQWDSAKVEFIIADALALPFRAGSVGSFSSLNLIDKVPSPVRHLAEMNRVVRKERAQFLLSDPFSWSEEAAPEEEWLGGMVSGLSAGRGIDNIMTMLRDDRGQLSPAWKIESHGHVWWRIRTHSNHYEQIRSCYVKACR